MELHVELNIGLEFLQKLDVSTFQLIAWSLQKFEIEDTLQMK